MSFGITYPRKAVIRRWLADHVEMLRDEIGQQAWAEIAAGYMLGHSFMCDSGATLELRYPGPASCERNQYLTRKQRDGRIRPIRALLLLAEGLLDEAIEPFVERYQLDLEVTRGFLMLATLSGEVEFRQSAGCVFMVEARAYRTADPFVQFARRRQRVYGPIPGKYAAR